MSNEPLVVPDQTRRHLLLGPLLAALPQLLVAAGAAAAPDSTKTIVVPAKDITFEPVPGAPPRSVEEAHLFSVSSAPGLYLNLTKWFPGWMSAPHFYGTDRLCVVVSGTWWVTSGDVYDPNATIPVSAGSFVHRIAHTSHYDGVKSGESEPAVIAICGMGPITSCGQSVRSEGSQGLRRGGPQWCRWYFATCWSRLPVPKPSDFHARADTGPPGSFLRRDYGSAVRETWMMACDTPTT